MKTRLILVFFTIAMLGGHAQEGASDKSECVLPGWYKISILYPDGDDKHFNMDYYSTKHMPMVASLFGDKLKGYAIDSGFSGRTPQDPATYLAVGYFYFEQLSDYQEAFAPNAEKIRGDIPNYTNIVPVVQVSQVIK